VLRCRRGFHVRPPALHATDPRSVVNDPRYASLAVEDLPHGESVADTQARVLPYWRERIAPEVARGRHVLVVSHKNTLRALLKMLRRATSRDIPPFAIVNGAPVVLTFEARDRWILGAAAAVAPSPTEGGA
jgi:2,3-bisphosphoglycerate-dependent phosphoglycerate mutase